MIERTRRTLMPNNLGRLKGHRKGQYDQSMAQEGCVIEGWLRNLGEEYGFQSKRDRTH